MSDVLEQLGPARWDGTPSRLEVWYATATDRATGTGLWWHHELVADPEGAAVHLGWLAVFPPDGAPVLRRWAPAPVDGPTLGVDGSWIAGAGTYLGPEGSGTLRQGPAQPDTTRLRGEVGDARWDVAVRDGGPPLWTFPRAAWRRELLPAAQIVPAPTARFTGDVEVGGRILALDGDGGLARIYGHGNAERWAWLHADLGGGDVCEVVAAVSRRPGLRALPPLAFVQLRVDGRDWPGSPALAAARSRVELDLPSWSVTVRWGARRLRIRVDQPAERCVAVDYADPDGAPAVCTNTERADADLVLERRAGGGWAVERSWALAACAHAEVGRRPAR
jgi:hypothetical protein